MPLTVDPVSLVLGLGVGLIVAVVAALGWGARSKAMGAAQRQPEIDRLLGEAEVQQQRAEQYRQRGEELLVQHAGTRAEAEAQRLRVVAQESELASLREDNAALRSQLAEARSRAEEKLRAAEDKLAAFNRLREELTPQFENLSNRLLEQKTASLKEHSQALLDQLLSPLRERIEGFQKQVSDTYGQERVERESLKLQIEQLRETNLRLGSEADSLVKALRGEQRIQGDWGEMVLERVLEASGLVPGQDFETQLTLRDEDGDRWRPDVVVRLPESRDLIVDAKVSLTAYVRANAAESDAERQLALREHLDSIRAHIRGLHGRDYSRLPGVRSPDFVLMFVPVEPALLDALRADPQLQEFALRSNVALVGPTTLLSALRTVSNLWRLERQNRNAQAIADRAAKLYDKFAGFVSDMQGIEKNLRQAQGAYDAAFAKLSTGNGNLLRQVQMLEKLGAKPGRRLPDELGDADGESEGEDAEDSTAGAAAVPRGLDPPAS